MLALVIALRNYRRKSGIDIRGSFTLASNIDCHDPYVAEYLIENLKDRTVTIFGVYLRVGWNIYIEVDLFDAPIVLKPFESHGRQFGAIEFYAMNGHRVDMRQAMQTGGSRKQLILSTSDGKYVISRKVQHWFPVTEFFKNHATLILSTVRSVHKGTDLGSNVAFAIELVNDEDKVQVIPIRPDDWQLMIFSKFALTQEALKTKATLESFLIGQKEIGNLNYNSLRVYDLCESRKQRHEFYSGKTVVAKALNAFQYGVLGRIVTLWQDRKLKQHNKAKSTKPNGMHE